MRRILARTAAGLAVALTALLAGCGKDETLLPPPNIDLPKPAVSQPVSVQMPVEEPQPESPSADPLAFKNEAALRKILVGTWTYGIEQWEKENTEAPQQITLRADGSFQIKALVWQDTSCEYTYMGKWTLERLYAEHEDPPDLLCLELDETDDPFLDGWQSLGDFLLAQRTLCDGSIVLGLSQANNGDSLFSYWYEDTWPVWQRMAELPLPQENLRKNDSFFALLWKMEYDGSGYSIWLDDFQTDTFENEGRYESLQYRLAPNASLSRELTAEDGQGPLPGSLYQIDTDEKGQVTAAFLYDSGPAAPLSEEEAAGLLSELEEVKEYLESGMIMLFDGDEGEFGGERCVIIALGTNNEASVVREYYYAVAPSGAIYRLNPVDGTWEPAGRG